MARLVQGIVVFLAACSVTFAADSAEPNTLTPEEIADGWILLFDGETTFGWKVQGAAAVKDGKLILGGDEEVVAVTASAFGNCEMQFDYQMALRKEASLAIGETDEALQGFLVPSHVELEVVGNSITRFAQGGALLGTRARGTINIENNPSNVSVRFGVPAGTKLTLWNMKLKPRIEEQIFNGQDLSGWKEIKSERSKSKFFVEDGELRIKNGPGDLQTEGQWKDFILQMDVKTNGRFLNSGVFFRCLPDQFWAGYESQIFNQWIGDRNKPIDYGTGGIYRRQHARRVVSNDNEWFTKTIVAHGNHMAVWVNGYQVSDFTDTRPEHANARQGSKLDKGPISLQGHDPTTDLSFRNIRILELSETSPKR